MEIIDDEKIQLEVDGEIKEYDILFTFTSEDTMRLYIGYTDHSVTDGRENIYVGAVSIDNPESFIQELDIQEKIMIMEVLEEIEEEATRM